jgi:hypothetical protein
MRLLYLSFPQQGWLAARTLYGGDVKRYAAKMSQRQLLSFCMIWTNSPEKGRSHAKDFKAASRVLTP